MFDRRNVLTLLGAGSLGLMIGARPALAATPEIYTNSSTGVAINGFDSVAYFTQSAHVLGSADFTLEWKGATWQFASAENRDMFEAAPEKYAPQYGGYCAFALAHNAIATTAPEAWTVHNDKLYLNFSLGVRTSWRKDPDGYIAKADANWPGVLG